MRIIIIIISTIAALFGISHLLQLQYITDSWLRYSIILLIALLIFAVGVKWVYLEIRNK